MRIPEDLIGKEKELEQIELFENTEPFVDIAQACPGILIQLYESPNVPREDPRALVRLGVALLLNKIEHELLPAGIHLMIRDAWRTPATQAGIHENQAIQIEQLGLAKDREEARTHADKYAVRPDDWRPPPHTTGGVVDVTLAFASGKQLFMRKEFKDCTPEEWQAQKARDYQNLSAEILKNRRMLREAMEAVGFASIPNEWWHFSYGEFWWAARTDRKRTLYLSVPKPLCVLSVKLK